MWVYWAPLSCGELQSRTRTNREGVVWIKTDWGRLDERSVRQSIVQPCLCQEEALYQKGKLEK